MTNAKETGQPHGPREKAVLLVASGDAITFDVSKVVHSIPNHVLTTQAGTLSGMNGTAVKLARSNDLVIFETTIDNTDDIAAVGILRDELDQQAKILVITPDDISLSQARMLTRAGADDVLTHPFVDGDLREHVERLTSPNPLLVLPVAPSAMKKQGKVFVVAKSRGGIGATTVAVNLAERLLGRTGMMRQKAQHSVALVDLDLQFGSIASLMDVEARDSLFHLAADGKNPDATFLQQSMVDTACGVHN
jgi:pilus assembly protein CpaE